MQGDQVSYRRKRGYRCEDAWKRKAIFGRAGLSSGYRCQSNSNLLGDSRGDQLQRDLKFGSD